VTAHSKKPRPPSADDEAAERAARVRAMIERWANEDVSREPTWDVDDIAPLALREPGRSDA
jgi:hypothetical protein